MHIDIVPNRNSKPAVLLRESYRDAKSKKPRKRTLANLSKLPSEQVDAISKRPARSWRKFVGWSSGAVCRARRTSVLQ